MPGSRGVHSSALARNLARLALLAALLLAIAPSISRVLGNAGNRMPAGWVELCTRAGLTWVEAASLPGSPLPAPATPASGDDCPYCPLAASLPLIPLPPCLSLPRPAAGMLDIPPCPRLHASVCANGPGCRGPPLPA